MRVHSQGLGFRVHGHLGLSGCVGRQRFLPHKELARVKDKPVGALFQAAWAVDIALGSRRPKKPGCKRRGRLPSSSSSGVLPDRVRLKRNSAAASAKDPLMCNGVWSSPDVWRYGPDRP